MPVATTGVFIIAILSSMTFSIAVTPSVPIEVLTQPSTVASSSLSYATKSLGNEEGFVKFTCPVALSFSTSPSFPMTRYMTLLT